MTIPQRRVLTGLDQTLAAVRSHRFEGPEPWAGRLILVREHQRLVHEPDIT